MESSESSDLLTVRVHAPAKINLSLSVGPPREDGFHPLATVFHAVSLIDDLTVKDPGDGSISVAVSGEGADQMPDQQDNLAVRAARLLRETYGAESMGADIVIRKRIPVAGGMAGGSADAAGTLLACSVLWDLPTTPDELISLAAQLGSDVAFPLVGHSAIGTGRGENLMPILSRGNYQWVLALAHEGLTTPEVFHRFDELGLGSTPAISDDLVAALGSGDAFQVARWLHNDLQPAAIDLYPDLAETLTVGMEAGALGGIVSGSGPTCAFLAATESEAMDIASRLAAAPTVREVKRATGPVSGVKLYNP